MNGRIARKLCVLSQAGAEVLSSESVFEKTGCS